MTAPLLARPPALLFEVPLVDVTMDETVELVHGLVARGRSTGATHQIATVNVDFLVNALDDERLMRILRRADACLADGTPVVWAARLLGQPIAERVAGSDLVPRLVGEAARTGLRVHVFGATPAVAEQVRALVAERHPGAPFTIDPGPMFDDPADLDDSVIDAIRAADPDVLLVALGNPKQELFIDSHRDRLGVPVSIGVGGSFDMMVGKRRRAPAWMQRAGLEWVYRAAQEPTRLGPRYARDIRAFLPLLVSERRAARRRVTAPLVLDVAEDRRLVSGWIGAGAAGADWADAAAAAAGGADLRLGRPGSTGPTASDAAVAAAIGLARLTRWSGGAVEIDPDDEVVDWRGHLHDIVE